MLVKSKIKYIQSLSQKKQRQERGVFIAEGPKLIDEFLKSGNVEVEEVFATQKWIHENPHWVTAVADRVTTITEDELARISLLQTPNQVAGIFLQPRFPLMQPERKVSLMLDTIQDPGNLGTIIRCADWFGITQIICSEDCVDVFNPKVVQASMGSICRVDVAYEDLQRFLHRHPSLPLYAAVLQGSDVTCHKKISEGFILIGNESRGIDAGLLALPHLPVTIPRKGNAESLNAAVAVGIILSHLL